MGLELSFFLLKNIGPQSMALILIRKRFQPLPILT